MIVWFILFCTFRQKKIKSDFIARLNQTLNGWVGREYSQNGKSEARFFLSVFWKNFFFQKLQLFLSNISFLFINKLADPKNTEIDNIIENWQWIYWWIPSEDNGTQNLLQLQWVKDCTKCCQAQPGNSIEERGNLKEIYWNWNWLNC